jgi:CRISPR-associated protein Cmr1
MNSKTYSLEFITPCFCGGAEAEKRAEVRPSAIRGQLRWWFRALGGEREEEAEVFGVAAGAVGKASHLIVRVSDVQRGPDWKQFPMKPPTSPGAYIWYYASVAEANGVPRWPDRKAHLPPKTRFQLHLLTHRVLGIPLQNKLATAVEAFLRFGGIGMRLTRGMGVWRCEEFSGSFEDFQAAAKRILEPAFVVRFRDHSFKTWEKAIFDAEKWLKNDLRDKVKGFKAQTTPESPVGGIHDNRRQTSAVYFRPLRTDNGDCELMIFEAPHQKVLSPQAIRNAGNAPMLRNRTFEGGPPETSHRSSRSGR